MTSTTAPRARRAGRHALVAAVATFAALLVPVVPASAAAPVPAPRSLPTAIEAFPEYQGATLCDPVVRSGPKALTALLTATYGTTSYGITRSCSGSTGSSEHNEGRAVDWMISGAAQQADAKAFLAWLFATDPAGNTYAMARRMGIMYVVWNNKMFRLYDTSRGWEEYQDCLSHPESSYDTTCHRNHVHFSFTWDGAAAATSYWSGKAVVAPSCASAPTASAAPAVTTKGLEYVPLTPYRVLDTADAVGVPSRCRLSQDSWTGQNRRIDVQVSGLGGVPTSGAVAVALAFQVDRPNAPSALVASATGSGKNLRVVTSGMGSNGPGSAVVPLGSGGRVSLTLSIGAADVTADVLGYYKVADGTGQRFHPVQPARVLNAYSAAEPLQPGESRTVQVAGLAGVPATGATAVTVAMTLFDPPQSGGASLFSADDTAPPGGQLSLTSPASGRRTNVLVTKLDSTGSVVVRNDGTGPRGVLLDVQGWWAPESVGGGSLYRLMTAKKLVETPTGLGLPGPLATNRTTTLALAGVGGIPATGVTAVALQTTALSPAARTALVVWPAGAAAPSVRTASIAQGIDHTAYVVAPLAGGAVSIKSTSGTVGLRSFAVGYWYLP